MSFYWLDPSDPAFFVALSFFIIVGVLILLGMIMEDLSLLVIMGPLLLPVVLKLGINPVPAPRPMTNARLDISGISTFAG